MEMGLKAKEGWQLPETRKDKEQIIPWSFQSKYWKAGTLILDQGN